MRRYKKIVKKTYIIYDIISMEESGYQMLFILGIQLSPSVCVPKEKQKLNLYLFRRIEIDTVWKALGIL